MQASIGVYWCVSEVLHVSILSHPQALSKKEKNKPQEAKLYSIVSFILVLIFVISYPILVTVVFLSTMFGYWFKPVYSYGGYSYYRYYYSRC